MSKTTGKGQSKEELMRRLEALKRGEITMEEFSAQMGLADNEPQSEAPQQQEGGAKVANMNVASDVVNKATTDAPIKRSKYPTIEVPLPSKGLLYSLDDPLSSGKVEIKYMTAKEEDILTTEEYIKNGTVLDQLFKSLIVSNINYDNLLLGDRDALMIYARAYAYGEEYDVQVTTPSGNKQTVTINLFDIPYKEFDESKIVRGENRFMFKTSMGDEIEFKLLTVGDHQRILQRTKKVRHGAGRDRQLTSRLIEMILSVNGNADKNFIRLFVENDFRALDSRAFRKYVADIQPGLDLNIEVIDEETGEPFRTEITFGLDFFWVDIRV